ncbi:MAG: nucleotidyltransferase family protein [Cyanobacteria bacterium J06639_1]
MNSHLNKQQILDSIKAQRDRLDEFSVSALFLFGSFARDEATSASDIDFLVEFSRPVGLFTYLGLKSFLEDLFDCSVDLGTPSSLRLTVRESVLAEAIRAV